MTDFTITISDQASLDGIAWVRERYNASLSDVSQAINTDGDYLSFIVQNMIAQWGNYKSDSDLADAFAKAKTGDVAQLQAIATSFTKIKAP